MVDENKLSPIKIEAIEITMVRYKTDCSDELFLTKHEAEERKAEILIARLLNQDGSFGIARTILKHRYKIKEIIESTIKQKVD